MKPSEFEAIYTQLCNFDRHLGLQLSVHAPGQITYRLKVGERHLSAPGACHGGVIAAMMDAVLGLTALSWAVTGENLCSTVEFKTHFFSPVRLGDYLEGTGHLDFIGSRLVVTTAQIIDTESGRLVAKGMGTFSLYPLAKHERLSALLRRQGKP